MQFGLGRGYDSGRLCGTLPEFCRMVCRLVDHLQATNRVAYFRAASPDADILLGTASEWIRAGPLRLLSVRK
jgi:hypothetical protein